MPTEEVSMNDKLDRALAELKADIDRDSADGSYFTAAMASIARLVALDELRKAGVAISDDPGL